MYSNMTWFWFECRPTIALNVSLHKVDDNIILLESFRIMLKMSEIRFFHRFYFVLFYVSNIVSKQPSHHYVCHTLLSKREKNLWPKKAVSQIKVYKESLKMSILFWRTWSRPHTRHEVTKSKVMISLALVFFTNAKDTRISSLQNIRDVKHNKCILC